MAVDSLAFISPCGNFAMFRWWEAVLDVSPAWALRLISLRKLCYVPLVGSSVGCESSLGLDADFRRLWPNEPQKFVASEIYLNKIRGQNVYRNVGK